jgi:hypothetical protein
MSANPSVADVQAEFPEDRCWPVTATDRNNLNGRNRDSPAIGGDHRRQNKLELR